MRFRLGILVCLLAGCVVQPTTADPPSRENVRAHIATLAGGSPFVLRIGIEHLPPDAGSPSEAEPRIEAQPRLAPPALLPTQRAERPREPDAAHRHTWSMSAGDLAAIDDPIARETLHFVQDLVDADVQRSRREVTMPFLGVHDHDPEGGPLLDSELALLAAQEEWIQERGPSLMRRPLQRLLRRMPFVEQIELEFDEFRSDTLPLTEPYQQQHGDRRSLGRMSLRVHVSDPKDPVEVAYVHSNVRLGTSQDRAKLSVNVDLSETVRLELRGSSEYARDEQHMRADLAYRPSVTTSLHLSIGDDMDFLSTSSIYSLFETPMDGSPGLVLYAVHLF